MNKLENLIHRVDLIRHWLDLGVFWDSVDDPERSADLGPLPALEDMEGEALEDLAIRLEDLRNDLNDNRPGRDTAADRAWIALQEGIDALEDAISEQLYEIEEEMFGL